MVLRCDMSVFRCLSIFVAAAAAVVVVVVAAVVVAVDAFAAESKVA